MLDIDDIPTNVHASNINSSRLDLNLGLVCINTILRNSRPEVFCSRSCVRRTFSVERAKQLALQNIADIIKMLDWNYAHNIYCMRLSSDIFPHIDDQELLHLQDIEMLDEDDILYSPYYKESVYTINFARDALKKAGDHAKKLGIRILMHPAQFNQVGALEQKVFINTYKNLKHHADILDLMGIDNNGVLIVHGGGTYGNREKTIDRWIKQFHMLHDNIKRRLVIENCEDSYNTEHVLYISKMCNIPVVFDFHHYACWRGTQKSIHDLMPEIIKSWNSADSINNRTVLMHVSEQAEGKSIGAHSDYIETIPSILFILCDKNNINCVHVDLEIEAKMKEQAILYLYMKYSDFFPYNDIHIRNHLRHNLYKRK